MNTIEVIQSKLDLIAEYQGEKDLLNLDKQRLIDTVITPEIKAKLAEIEAEFAGKGEAADANIADLTAEVKEMVIQAGASVKAKNLHAVYAKGRISWDNKGLDGFALTHPEILYMRKEGEPSVSIRKV